MPKIRVVIFGVGNCVSASVQGVVHHSNPVDDSLIPGVTHADLGGYRVRDIEFTAAFDTARRWVEAYISGKGGVQR